ncbi:MAG: argininosuccinate synthase [Chloroflexi bacterium]|nr:argininosuccinate synthase [Chloroflexota bacterium]
MAEKCVLAYSGGLDTSVAVKWLMDNYGVEVVTLTVDVGGEIDLQAVKERALATGAVDARILEVKDQFVRYFVFPALQAGAVYEGKYPLATALARPLMAYHLVEVAREVGAGSVAHGCTGKGNDQVRFDVGVRTLEPGLKIIAPAREWGMDRDQEIEYARKHNIPVPLTKASPYSIDENLWGRSIETGVLEDPAKEPPEDVYQWTLSPEKSPDRPQYLNIDFEGGIPTGLDRKEMDGVSLIQELNRVAGTHGVGRIDHVENRLVGIKSREIYESPAAVILHAAHKSLEALTLSKDQARTKARLAQEYADLVYNGLWFTAHRQDLDAYVASTQRYVTGEVRVRLQKGTCTVVGSKASNSLYQYSLATYDKGDQFDHSSAQGFISIYGLPVRTQNQAQPQ